MRIEIEVTGMVVRNLPKMFLFQDEEEGDTVTSPHREAVVEPSVPLTDLTNIVSCSRVNGVNSRVNF